MDDNAIEWYKGADRATLTLSEKRYINKVKKLVKDYPEVDVYENEDGSVLAHVPTKFIRITPPRQLSEESKQRAAERLKRVKTFNKETEK